MTDYTERAREWLERQAASNLTISGDAASLANLLSQIEREVRAADIAASCPACARGVKLSSRTLGRHTNGHACGAFGIRSLSTSE